MPKSTSKVRLTLEHKAILGLINSSKITISKLNDIAFDYCNHGNNCMQEYCNKEIDRIMGIVVKARNVLAKIENSKPVSHKRKL